MYALKACVGEFLSGTSPVHKRRQDADLICENMAISESRWWARLGLNQRLRCQRSALPLSYAPGKANIAKKNSDASLMLLFRVF